MSSLNEFIEQTDWPTSILVTDGGWILEPDIVDGLPVWDWESESGKYTTRVVLDPANRRQVHWQVWEGDYQLSDRPMETFGVKAALHLIANWRIFGLDEREVRRAVEIADEAANFALYPEPCRTCPDCGCPGMN